MTNITTYMYKYLYEYKKIFKNIYTLLILKKVFILLTRYQVQM